MNLDPTLQSVQVTITAAALGASVTKASFVLAALTVTKTVQLMVIVPVVPAKNRSQVQPLLMRRRKQTNLSARVTEGRCGLGDPLAPLVLGRRRPHRLI